MNRLLGAVLGCLLLGATGARAQDEEQAPEVDERVDAPGLKDHPAYKRYPKSVLKEATVLEFEAFDFPTSDEEVLHAEGAYSWGRYWYLDNPSCTQLIRNYESAFKAAGLKTFKGKNFPSATVDSAKITGEAWVTGSGKGKRGGQVTMVQTCDTGAHNGEVWGDFLIVETQAMAQKVELDADGMLSELEKSGHVALYGITFETGKAEITLASAKTLEQIAQLLNRKPEWKLVVEGHTDNVGKAKANLELSKKRALAVKEWLVTRHRVAAARLATEGFGDSKPIADNRDDEGKAKNRRVELVKR